MKITNMVVFIIIVLSIYSLANYYIYIRGLQAINQSVFTQYLYKSLFFILSTSFIAYKFIENSYYNGLTKFIGNLGHIWFAAMVYFILILIIIDIIRFTNTYFTILPDSILANYTKTKLYLFYTSILIVSIILIIGYFNNLSPIIKEINISINAKEAEKSNYRIIMASDIHLCPTINTKKVDKLVNMINSNKPDIILFAGDIIDGNPKSLIHYKIGEPLKQLQAKYGVWGINGNHEYIGNIDEAVKYLESLNINILRDTAILINNSFWLIGREDKDISRFTKNQRKPLNQIIKYTNNNFPKLLLDHQPTNLKESINENIDLQLSGHTHNGQLWPGNIITNAIFEISYGYKKINNCHFYVSSGYGLWGPPIRTVNKPEIVLINLLFE